MGKDDSAAAPFRERLARVKVATRTVAHPARRDRGGNARILGNNPVHGLAPMRFTARFMSMVQERTERALDRLAMALARLDRVIESSAVRQSAAVASYAEGDLGARHEQLRAAVSRSLRQLDSLIESQSATGSPQ